MDELFEDDHELEPGFMPGISTLPNLPISLPNLSTHYQSNPQLEALIPADFMNEDNLAQPLITGGTPVVSTLKNKPERPGWFDQVSHDLLKYNTSVQAGKFAYNLLTENPASDIPPEGWTAMTPEAVEGFPDKYFDYLTDAKSPGDLAARQQRLREQAEEDEKYENGSLTQSLISGALAGISDPISYLLPFTVGMKYAGIAQNIFLNMEKTAGAMALDSVSRNMLIQANRSGGNVQDMAIDSATDFIFGTALVGAGAAIGGGLRESKLWNMRKTVAMTMGGVNINPVVNDKGIISGYKASTARGMVENAALTDAANLYIHESMSMTGAFGLPGIGKPLQKFFSWGPLASPVLKAAASPYQSVKSFFNRIAPNGVITEGEAAGQAVADSAHDISQHYADKAVAMSDFTRGQYLAANGIEGGTNVKNLIKNMRQVIAKDQRISQEDFGKEIRRVAYEEGYKSPWPSANVAADEVLKFFEEIGVDYHASKGEEGTFANPRTSFRYLPQNYNIPMIISNPNKFVEIIEGEYKRMDELSVRLQGPLVNAENRLSQLQEAMRHPEFKETRALANEIADARRNVRQEHDALIKQIRDNPGHQNLLDDRALFDSAEVKKFNQIMEPMNLIKKEHAAAEAELSILNNKLSQVKSSLDKNKNVATRDNNLKIMKYNEDAIEGQNLKIREIQDRMDEEHFRLQEEIHAGNIDRKFFEKEGFEYKARDVNARPKFRTPFASDFERNQFAQQTKDSILNQSPTDLLHAVLGSAEPGIVENPKYLQKRSILIDSQIFNKTDFLDPDISKSVSAYAGTFGKIIGFKKALPEFSQGKGFEGVLFAFKHEHQKRVDKVLEEPESQDRAKKLHKIDKEFKQAEKFMSDTYKVYMGTYASETNPEFKKISTSLKNLVVSAKLGAVPIYQIAELGAIVLKQGLMPFLAQGLRPAIKTLNGKLEGREAQAFRDNAANAHIALNHVQNGYAQRLINGHTMSEPPTTTAAEKLGVWSDNLAHMSGNIFGTNYVANLNERISANAFQSEVMQAMFAHKEGRLTDKQRVKMARYGIQVEDWSSRFIKGYEDAEGWSMSGGYQSQYFKWGDAEAANRMSLSIRRAVHDTVVNRNAFTSPYWANNPFMSMIFMFHGWAYGAFNHYAVPMMQRPDAEAILGTVSVVGLSMLAEPMLRLANGKTAYDDDTTWFDEAFKSVEYSGMLGPYPQYLMDLNNAFGGALVPHLQPENQKMHGQGIVGSGGPVAGYLNDLASTLGHGLKGDYTENDVKRGGRLLPFASHLLIRDHSRKYIESFNLPQTRKGANSWAWREQLLGE